jgi:NAD(P)-dependent dehydrogenase (short-subunit alcohol dehydrogenase family)
MPYHASIAAAKGGVESLALSLAAEFASQNIRVNVVAPSLTDTSLAGNLLNTAEKRESLQSDIRLVELENLKILHLQFHFYYRMKAGG